MSNVRIVVFLICFAVASFGADRQILQKEFDAKKDLYEKLHIDFERYTSMEEPQQEAYKERLTQLLDVQNLTKHLTDDTQSTKDAFEIFSPYINLHSYFIAKYAPQEELILPSLILMSGVLKYSKEDAYLETYMLLLAHNKKFEEPLVFYPKFIESYDIQEVKDNFKIVKQLALASAIQNNDLKLLQKLKDSKVDFNAPLANGKPPIFEAMFSKEREVAARFLLENGVDKKSIYFNESILYSAVKNHFSEEFVKYLLAIGCDKNYHENSFTSSIDNNPYMYAKVYRSDFYSKDVLALLRPDDYANRKLAFLYAKNKLYDDLIDFIEHTSSVEVFQDPNYVNLLEELTRTYPHEYKLPQIQKEKAIEAMKLLIVKGADLNQTTMNNPNSFENIVFEKDFPKEFVEFALTLGDPNKKYYIKGRKTHWTPLFGAIATKNKEAFEKLLKDGADVNYKDEDGLDAFYFAVFSGQIEIAKRVLESGFTLNLNPKTKRHPLAIAVLSSNIEMLEYLLSLGFDTKKELFDRKHLLEFALTSPNKDIGREQQPLFINLEMYRYLFESFKDELNTPSDIGYHNLLLSKSGTNAFEALKILLVMGVDVHQNNKGYSPLQFLNEDEYFEQKVQILLAQKININNQDKDGDTPLHQFVIYSITAQEDMETYKDKKTDIETEELDIANILSFVQASQKTEFLERKKSSLELYKKTIKLFIENGADITLKNKQNKTPYDLALHGKIKDKELLELLRI